MIVDHPTLCYRGVYGFSESCKVVKCDFCGHLSNKVGNDLHEAVEAAHQDGYSTVRGRTSASPRKWCCAACRQSLT